MANKIHTIKLQIEAPDTVDAADIASAINDALDGWCWSCSADADAYQIGAAVVTETQDKP